MHVKANNNERVLQEDDFLISKTDLSGKITYANQLFIKYSGYRQSETYNHQHSLVRHPDMPQAVFNLLWQTIKAGHEFNGYVKNLCKDGSFYWVFANVTPSFDNNNNIIGYYSVRRKPSTQAIAAITPLYQAMRSAERQENSSKTAVAAGNNILQAHLSQQEMDYDQFVLSL